MWTWCAKCQCNFLAILLRDRKSKSNIYVCAIDIWRVFDFLLRSKVIQSLFKSGVIHLWFTSLWKLYQKARIWIHLQGAVSSRIRVWQGVKEDSVLSSTIFNNAIRVVTRQIPIYLIEHISMQVTQTFSSFHTPLSALLLCTQNNNKLLLLLLQTYLAKGTTTL